MPLVLISSYELDFSQPPGMSCGTPTCRVQTREEQKEIMDTQIVEDEISDDDQSYDLSAISRQIREIP